jgi:hypothetical protein
MINLDMALHPAGMKLYAGLKLEYQCPQMGTDFEKGVI